MPIEYQGLLNAAVRDMTKGEAQAFCAMSLAEKMDPEMPKDMRKVLNKDFGYQVLSKRLDYFKIPVGWHLKVLVVSLCRNPAQVVMWAYTLALLYKEKKAELTMGDFLSKFPKGVPTEEALNKAWDEQKRLVRPSGGTDNWLDYPEQWPVFEQQPPPYAEPATAETPQNLTQQEKL